MQTVWEGHIAGIFEGYQGGRVYELSDGGRWRQESNTREYVYREQPKAKLVWDQSTGTRFLDVEGTSSVMIIVPGRGRAERGGVLAVDL